MIDWKDPARVDNIRFQMVSPNNLNEVYGDLDLVQLDSAELSYGYYVDTRYSGEISFLEGNYVTNSWIRVIHEVPADNYVKELGTFIPTSPTQAITGAMVTTLDLQSPLWGMKDDLATSTFTIGKGASLIESFKRVCEICNRPYVLKGANDTTLKKSAVYEAGESYLSILFAIAELTNNELGVDGHGNITLAGDVPVSAKASKWLLDYDDPRSLIVEDSVQRDSEIDEMPSRVIVINDKIVGFADVDAGTPYSAQQRGYTIATSYVSSDVKSSAEAAKAAKALLDQDTKIMHWTMETLYFPCECGDMADFVYNGEKHRCMIQSIDPLKLSTMTMHLTLREVFD